MTPMRRISRAVLATLLLLLVLGPPVDAMRSRVSANEAATIGDIRTLITSQHAYSSANGATIIEGRQNFDGRLECLVDWKACVPGYAGLKMGMPTLDAVFVGHRSRHGYTFTFHAGPAIAPEALKKARASASTVHDFAYVGVPDRPESKYPDGIVACLTGRRNSTGKRGFCGDGTGVICYTNDGSAPPVTNGRCEPCPDKIY
jgi:hypothetical protein